jgi:hypothetical protein
VRHGWCGLSRLLDGDLPPNRSTGGMQSCVPLNIPGYSRGIDDKEALELLATGWDKIGDTAMLHTSAHAVEPTRGLGPEAT